jgi:hypothetical protein
MKVITMPNKRAAVQRRSSSWFDSGTVGPACLSGDVGPIPITP